MWNRTLLCLCTVYAVWAEVDMRESKLVHIAQGPVQGYKDPDSGIYFFQGIPYASIPTGPNRFKAPLPPPTWLHPLEAVDKNIACPQGVLQGSFSESLMDMGKKQEDCLIANVYVPDTKENNLSVVAYVHGGGFQVGKGDWMKPINLIAETNIIFVSFNYRVGVHGFLCLGTEDVPGNAGMKDQVAALRWVKKNIASFGGNPDDITIHGSSAGSAAVDLLMLSKSAEGLFNKVIPESGASIAPWTIQSDPIENAKRYAKYLNFTNVNDFYALEEFYKSVPLDLLSVAPFFENIDSTFGASPCVERTTGEEVFLDMSPVDILKSGNYRKVPLLYGFANMEGLMRIFTFDNWKHRMNEKFSDFVPADLKFKSKEEKENVAIQIKKFYFGDEPVGDNNVLDYVDFFTDVIFAYPMLRTVRFHVEAGHKQIYLYEYSFVDVNTPNVPYTNVKGASHCAQSGAVFGELGLQISQNVTQDYLRMSSTLRKIWGSFIKTGKPSIAEDSSMPPWPPVTKNWSPHMSLSNEISLKGPLLEGRMRFWDDIYSKYYRDPTPPSVPTRTRSEL